MIFVDTSFWIARLLRRDRRHHEATDINRATTGERLVTSDHVVGETRTFLARCAGQAGAVAWLDQLLGSTVNVERISADDARRAASRNVGFSDRRGQSDSGGPARRRRLEAGRPS